MPRPRALLRRGGLYVWASTYISSKSVPKDVSRELGPPDLGAKADLYFRLSAIVRAMAAACHAGGRGFESRRSRLDCRDFAASRAPDVFCIPR
jgi:hypothetical protein